MSYSIPIRLLDELGRTIESELDVKSLRQGDTPIWNVLRPQLVGTHVWSFDDDGAVMAAAMRRTMPVYEQLARTRGRGGMLMHDGRFRWSRAERVYEGRHVICRSLGEPERRPIAIFEPIDGLRLTEEGRLESRLFGWAYDLLGQDNCMRVLPGSGYWRGVAGDGPMLSYQRVRDDLIFDPRIAEPLEGVAALLTLLDRLDLPNPFSEHTFCRWVRSVQARAVAFEELLAILEPELVLMTTFKSSEHLALSHACRAKGIRILEYQHGILGPEYRAVPLLDERRDWVPHGFWLWGESSADWMRHEVGGAELFVGGANARPVSFEPPSEAPASPTKSILLVEQYTHASVADMVGQAVAAIQRSGIDAELRLRVHPRSMHLVDEYDADIRAAGYRVDVHRASHEPLADVLAASDLVLVESSTVAYDANSAGRRVVVFGDASDYLFQDDIRRGAFHWVPSLARLDDVLREALDAPFVRSRFFASEVPTRDEMLAWLKG